MASKKLSEPQMKQLVTAGVDSYPIDEEKKQKGLDKLLTAMSENQKAHNDRINGRVDALSEKFGDILMKDVAKDDFSLGE